MNRTQQMVDAAAAEYRAATAAQASAAARALQTSKRHQGRRARALIAMRRLGLSYRDIATTVGVSTARVYQIIDQYRKENDGGEKETAGGA